MSDAARRPLAEMESIARALVEELRPYCERIEIAGSIRRQKPEVGDVEIVCIPKIEAVVMPGALFSEARDRLADYATAKLMRDEWSYRLGSDGKRAFGPKFKRLLVDGVPLDLFSTSAEQWGLIFLIRTGPAEFSRRMVTQRFKGGWLANDLFVRDGALWRGDEMVRTPEERDVFAAAGVPWVEPEARR